MSMVTMQDIADKLGISKAAVSIALSGNVGKRISEETVRLVRQTAKELNYRKNGLATSLKIGKTNTIGVLVTDISNEFFGQVVFHIQEEAKRYGYMVLSANTNEDPKDFADAVDMMLSNKVDGIIAVPTEDCFESLKMIKAKNIPLVLFDRYYNGIDADYVGINNYGVTRKSVSNLISQGYKHIGMLNYDLGLNALKEREKAFKDELMDNGIYDEQRVWRVSYENQESDVEEAIKDLFELLDSVDAIFFSCRRIFITAMKHMCKFGMNRIEEKKFLCFDDVNGFIVLYMNIDYIKQPVKEMGKKSLRLLLDKIDGDESVDRYLFDATFVSSEKKIK